MTSKVIEGHIRPLLFQETFVYGLILMNANILKTQFFHKIIYDLNCHFYVTEKDEKTQLNCALNLHLICKKKC